MLVEDRGAEASPTDLSTPRQRPPCGHSSALQAAPGSPTGRPRSRSSSPGPGGWVLGRGRSASRAGPGWPSRSSAACTPRGRPPGPTCRHTETPTGHAPASPRGQRRGCHHPPAAGRGSLGVGGRGYGGGRGRGRGREGGCGRGVGTGPGRGGQGYDPVRGTVTLRAGRGSPAGQGTW